MLAVDLETAMQDTRTKENAKRQIPAKRNKGKIDSTSSLETPKPERMLKSCEKLYADAVTRSL